MKSHSYFATNMEISASGGIKLAKTTKRRHSSSNMLTSQPCSSESSQKTEEQTSDFSFVEVPYPQNGIKFYRRFFIALLLVTMWNFTDFLLLPTLVYQTAYPRKLSKIRYWYAIKVICFVFDKSNWSGISSVFFSPDVHVHRT